MLSSNLLVSPVLAESGTVFFYVPGDPSGGEWMSWFDYNKKHGARGGKWCTETYGVSELPLLVRLCAVTPINRTLKKTDDASEEGLELLVCGTLVGEEVSELADVTKTHEVKRRILTVKADGDKVQAVDTGLKLKISYM